MTIKTATVTPTMAVAATTEATQLRPLGWPALLQQLRDLTRLRNQIVHAGARVDRAVAYPLTFAVEKLITWLG